MIVTAVVVVSAVVNMMAIIVFCDCIRNCDGNGLTVKFMTAIYYILERHCNCIHPSKCNYERA